MGSFCEKKGCENSIAQDQELVLWRQDLSVSRPDTDNQVLKTTRNVCKLMASVVTVGYFSFGRCLLPVRWWLKTKLLLMSRLPSRRLWKTNVRRTWPKPFQRWRQPSLLWTLSRSDRNPLLEDDCGENHKPLLTWIAASFVCKMMNEMTAKPPQTVPEKPEKLRYMQDQCCVTVG